MNQIVLSDLEMCEADESNSDTIVYANSDVGF